ncbi:MAG: hypothetical protein ACOYLS_07030 [Polymorphobacter sp.]
MRLLWLTLLVATAAPAAAQLSVEKRADPAVPVVLKPGQGALVVGYRRPDDWSAGKSGTIAFARYDVEKRDMIARPKDAKKNGDPNTYWISVRSGDRKLPLDHAIMVVSAGDYVLYGATPGPGGMVANSFCFSAPVIHVGAGETVYFGDITPYIGAKLADGGYHYGMAFTRFPADAKAAVEQQQPGLAASFKDGEVRNGASFTCAAQAMSAYIAPGQPSLPDLSPEEKARRAKDAPVSPPRQAVPAPAVPIMVPAGG